MDTKWIMNWFIAMILLAALPGLTAALAQEQAPALQGPVVTDQGEALAAFPWSNTESEPNNSVAAAEKWCSGDYATCGGIHGGIISSANDVDYWELFVPGLEDDVTPGYTELYVTRDNYPFLIDLEAQSIGSPLDAVICLYSDDGYELACNNTTDTVDPMLYYNFEVTGSSDARRYYLTVRAYQGSGAGPNGKYQLLLSTPYLFSASATNLGAATVGGIPFQAGDILAFSKFQGGYKWVMLLDLSDLGVKGNITSLSSGWRNSDYLLVGFAANATLPGIGRPVTPWEVVVFDPTQVGPSTQGTFAFFWDSRAQGLTTTAEKVDAIDWPTWNGVTRLYASTVGNAKVYGGPGPLLRLPDEDIGLWSDGPAAQSYPRWARHFDTSVGNPDIVDVIGYSYTLYHSLYIDFYDREHTEDSGWNMVVQGVPGVSQKDVVNVTNYYDYWGGDDEEEGWYSEIIWHGPDFGWNYNLDAIQVQRTMWGMQ